MTRPSISIVTVSLNNVNTIEQTIRSVLDQPLPVEYIVIDGGSTDGTRRIIERYADRLSYWVSEPDQGQSHALNKGFSRATGDVIGWLNADDLLLPNALTVVQRTFLDQSCDVLCGACRYDYPGNERRVQTVTPAELRQLHVYDPIHQPSCFWRRNWHERVGGLDEHLHYGMDWDLWLRLKNAGAQFKTVEDVLSVYRVTGVNKTSTGGERRNREMYAILKQHNRGDERHLASLAFHLLWPLKRLRRRRPEWLYARLSNAARTMLLVALGPMFGFARVRRSTHPFS